MMHWLLWLSTLWPFHHKALPPPPPPALVIPVDPGQGPRVITPNGAFYVPMSLCDKTSEGDYLFLGPDGVVGIGSTCDGAFVDWNNHPAPRPLPRA